MMMTESPAVWSLVRLLLISTKRLRRFALIPSSLTIVASVLCFGAVGAELKRAHPAIALPAPDQGLGNGLENGLEQSMRDQLEAGPDRVDEPTPNSIALPNTGPTSTKAVISIIIDDMGYRLADGQRALELPGPLAYSFLPHTPNASRLTRKAQQLGKVILLHLPMEPERHGLALGPGALLSDMSELQIHESVHQSLLAIPQAVGVNNHMGSLLTKQDRHMQWVMSALKERELFFVDSKTTAQSVATKAARAHNIPYLTRDVFLDNEQTPAYITRQFNILIALAQRSGSALAIAHPLPTTIAVLEELLGTLPAGVQLVSLDELMLIRTGVVALIDPTQVLAKTQLTLLDPAADLMP